MNDWMANDYLHPSSKKESNFKNESEKKIIQIRFFYEGTMWLIKKRSECFLLDNDDQCGGY